MRCIKHVIRYISIKQLWNLSKYVLNNKGCRWLADWIEEQRAKELMEGIGEPSSENWEDSWFSARIWYMYLCSTRAKMGPRPIKEETINSQRNPKTKRNSTKIEDREILAHKNLTNVWNIPSGFSTARISVSHIYPLDVPRLQGLATY